MAAPRLVSPGKICSHQGPPFPPMCVNPDWDLPSDQDESGSEEASCSTDDEGTAATEEEPAVKGAWQELT